MAAKKPRKPTKSRFAELQDDASVLKLSELELMTLSRYDAESRAAQAEIAMLQAQKTAYLAKIDPNGVLAKVEENLRARKQNLLAVQATYKACAAEIGARLDISLEEYSFDDKTGVLHHIVAPVPPT